MKIFTSNTLRLAAAVSLAVAALGTPALAGVTPSSDVFAAGSGSGSGGPGGGAGGGGGGGGSGSRPGV